MYNSYKKKSYNQRLSDAINWLRFPLIFLIIMLHCYSVQRLEGGHDMYFKVVYPFALWLGETGVPGFFFISGFLFFMSKKTYQQKIESRVHTLLVPYFIWNTILLILYLVLYALGHPLDINRRNLVDYEFADYLRLFWLFNIPALLLLADKNCRLSFSHRMQFLSQAAFIVFCIHYPIVLLLRKICIAVFSSANDLIHVCLYFICVFITTVLSISFYKLLDNYFPKIKKILSGNR